MVDSVVFVSLGPGDPELITVKGLKILLEAECVFCPCTLHRLSRTPASRAKNMLGALGVEESKIHLFEVPMSKDRSKALEAYRQMAQEAAELYLAGKRVAVTAEGDAGLYSSVHYIGDRLAAMKIPVTYIAGVPSFVASAALAKIHLAGQEEELDILPGLCSLDDLEQRVSQGRSVVIMKPSQSETVIKEMLHRLVGGEVHYFENVGIQGEEFYTCQTEEILFRSFPYFSLILFRK